MGNNISLSLTLALEKELNYDKEIDEEEMIPGARIEIECFQKPFNRWMTWSFSKTGCKVNKIYELKDGEDEPINGWKPKTHMRDFEVIDSFTPQEKKIARGQGYGVIVFFPSKAIAN